MPDVLICLRIYVFTFLFLLRMDAVVSVWDFAALRFLFFAHCACLWVALYADLLSLAGWKWILVLGIGACASVGTFVLSACAGIDAFRNVSILAPMCRFVINYLSGKAVTERILLHRMA